MYFLCYDIGGIDIKMGIVNENGLIIRKKIFPTQPIRTPKEIISDMLFRARILVNEVNLEISDISAIGIGVPGLADNNSGRVLCCTNIFWNDVPIRDLIKSQLDVPIFLLNDATIAAIAEHKNGACKGAKNSITITLGTGIGGGIVIDNKIYEGSYGGSGEIGHMIIMPGGEQCNCGNKGCFEMYCSASALIKSATNAANQNKDSMLTACMLDTPLTGKDVVDCAKAGDAVALKVFDQYTEYLSLGIISLINIFDPDIIAIGGGIAKAGDFLLSRINVIPSKRRIFNMLPPVKIVGAKFSNDAGIIGAAMLCASKLEYNKEQYLSNYN